VESLFARRLRDERERRGLSQAKLAERLSGLGLKIDDLAILRMEKNAAAPGKGRRIRLGEAQVIAKALGTRLAELLVETQGLEEQLAHLKAQEMEVRSRGMDFRAAADRDAWEAERLREEIAKVERMIGEADEGD